MGKQSLHLSFCEEK